MWLDTMILVCFLIHVCMLLIYSGQFASWMHYKYLILRTVFWYTENFILMHLSKFPLWLFFWCHVFWNLSLCSEVTYSPIQKSWFCFSYLSLHMLPSLLVTKTVYPCLYLQDYFYFLHQMFYNRIVPVTFMSEFFQHIFLNLWATSLSLFTFIHWRRKW